MLRRIGGGSYGEVWLARSVTGAHRAVKIVRREDFDLERTFEREFKGIQHYEKVSQGHAGLVDVLHVGRNDGEGFYYYVMELADDVDGYEEGAEFDAEHYRPRTLAADLKKLGTVELASCVETGRRLAGALGHLHRNGLTHRDVKPANIIFVRGEPQMADIGLVAASGQRSYVGTEGYVPPEGPGTAVADLYSLAMVLYEMHTGKDRLDFPELPTNLELPRTVNRDQWRALNNVICRAGAPDPKKRFETAESFVAALGGVTAGKDGLRSGSATENGRGSGGSRAVMVAALLVLLAAVGFGGWKLSQVFSPDGNGGLASNGDAPGGNSGDSNGGGGAGTGDSSTDEGPTALPPTTLAMNGDGKPTTTDGNGVAPVFQDPDSPATSDLNGTVGGKGDGSGISGDGKIGSDTTPSDGQDSKPAMALVKVFSDTPGAAVLQGETLLGYTPTGYLEMAPGKTELMLRLEGYHDEVVERELLPGPNVYIHAQMRQDRRPIPGQDWTNSQGLRFIYEGDVASGDGMHISAGVIGVEPVETFLQAVGREGEPLVGIQGATALAANDQWAFCDWMTHQDRRAGFLTDNEYHRPQRTLTKGMEGAFFCVIDRKFGELEINSEPSGASVFRGGARIGITPLLLEHERIGPMWLSLDMPGFRSVTIEAVVLAGRRAYESPKLERDDSLVFGQPWTNSLGMKLVGVGDLMASVFETRVQDYAAFTTSAEGKEHLPLEPPFEQMADHPVVGVGLENARAFCRWLTEKERASGHIENYHEYRLPTDLEWSVMAGLEDEGQENPGRRDARAPKNVFPWGGDWPPPEGAGNFLDESASDWARQPVLKGYQDGFEKIAPVGQFKANPYGLHDLAGNAWEWVGDLYGGEGSPLATVRGGGFNVSNKDLLLTGYRNAVSTSMRDSIYGFRCVLVEDRGLAETLWQGR
jgi:hypothetical protein